jgi:hypothetical protein
MMFITRARFIQSLLILTIAPAISSPRALADTEWSVTNAQFQSSREKISSLDAQGIHIALASGGQSVMSWDGLLEITRVPDPSAAVAPLAAATQPAKFDLFLIGGDRITGEPVSVASEKLQWKSPVLGDIEIPLNRLAAICRAGSAIKGIDESRADDVVRLGNGDSAHGIVTQISSSGVALQAGDATPTLAWDTVTDVLFSTPPGGGIGNKRMFRVRFNGDVSITVPAAFLAGDQITINFDAKTSRTLPVSVVQAIEQINGPVSWLTALAPAENIYKPYFSENFPARFDRTVEDGQPIREKFPQFHHGIGCHSYSKLVYDLDGKYPQFRTQFAVDSQSPLADVTVRILLDGKLVFERKNVKAGQIYPVQLVPLNNAKTLALEVDYGENLATQDRFVWLDPALIRSAPRP